ncbi:unnamed protein product [Laminaria digitata]
MPPPPLSNVGGAFRLFVVIGLIASAMVLLTIDAYPNLFSIGSVVEEIWTAEDLSSMAESSTMAAAGSFLTAAAHGWRAPALKFDEFETLIDGLTAAHIRTAILMVTHAEITDKFDKFARSTNAAATCSTEGTAGENGLDECLAGCEQKRHFLAWTPNKGACYMLCALAASPCTKNVAGTTTVRPVTWGTMPKDWEVVTFWIMMTVVAPLYVMYIVSVEVQLRALRALYHEETKQQEATRRETVQEILLLMELERDLQEFVAWETGQRRAQDGQLSAARGARIRREGGCCRMFRRRG